MISTATLDRVSADVTSARQNAVAALAFVNSIQSVDEAGEAFDRVRLVKEWAKIRKISREVHEDLLRLEIHCLRKIAQLDAIASLPRGHRSTAEYYRDLTDSQIDDLIRDFGDKATPLSLRQRAAAKADFDAGRRHVTDLSYLQQNVAYTSDEVAAAVERHVHDTKGALASLLENYVEGDEGFSIYELTEQVVEQCDLTEQNALDWGIRSGLAEVCRKAVRDAPDVMIAGSKAPRFVTCLDRSTVGGSDHWIRVPFHAATVEQLRDMVKLRAQQSADAASAAGAIRDLYERLSSASQPGDYRQTLGEIAARLALATEVEAAA